LESFGAVKRFMEIQEVHEPDLHHHGIYQKLMPIFDACYHALEGVYREMANG
jgi:hypothetical protein